MAHIDDVLAQDTTETETPTKERPMRDIAPQPELMVVTSVSPNQSRLQQLKELLVPISK